MKILCTGCGQLDDLLCGGICPYCGRYNDSAAQQQEAQGGLPCPHGSPRARGNACRGCPGGRPGVCGAARRSRQKPVHTGVLPGILCAQCWRSFCWWSWRRFRWRPGRKGGKKAQGFVQAAGTAQAQQNEAFPWGR